MTLPQVAQEWEKAINAPQGVLSVSGVSVSVPESAARKTVSQLEAGAIAQLDLTDQKVINGSLQHGLDNANVVIGTQATEITGLKSTLVLQNKACDVAVAKVKADSRKSKRTWFVLGFVSGVATRLFLKF
jgi:hypothetical protein